MPEICVIVYDNGLPSQNQDYLPSRSILQKEFIQSAISKKFENDPNTMIGIIPIAQNQFNDITTPTKQKDYLFTYISKVKLGNNTDHITALNQALFSFQQREITTKNLYMFLGSEIDTKTEDIFFEKVLEVLLKGININIMFFGECLHLYEIFTSNIDHPSLQCFLIDPETDFGYIHDKILFGDDAAIDPEMEEAIRLSLEEQNKNK